MDANSPSSALPTPHVLPTEPVRRRRRSREDHVQKGRWWALGIFVAFRLVDLVLYLSYSMSPVATSRSTFDLFIIVSWLWTTALVAAVYLRQAWARYILIVLVAGLAGAQLWVMPDMVMEVNGYTINPSLLSSVFIYMLIFCALVFSKSLRRLTTQNYM